MPRLIGPGTAAHTIADDLSGGLHILSFEDFQLHAGQHYFISGYVTLANGGKIDFAVTTPDSTEWLHMVYAIETTAPGVIDVYKNITGLAGGTELTPINGHGNEPVPSAANVKLNPTLTLGDKIDGYRAGANGGKLIRATKLILEKNNTYLWRIVSEANGNIINYRAEWYEHSRVVVL